MPVTKSKGVGGHQRGYRGHSDDWLTPPNITKTLGPFDLDPCASEDQPWATAQTHWTITHDGLARPWRGRVWLNPPYGPDTWKWLARLAEHGQGSALIFARTETKQFHRLVWESAQGLLFLEGRLHFHHPKTGQRSKFNAGAPSVLVAYGLPDAAFLKNTAEVLRGHYVGL